MAMLRILVSLAVTGMLINVAMATSYTVGAPNGSWNTNTNLQAWASSKSFSPGDNLVFQYSPELHDVLEVTNANYDSCQTSSPLQTHIDGNTVIPLTSPGKRYFICGTPGHCSLGMKVEIDTLATSAPPPTSPTTPPPTATTPSTLPRAPPPPTSTTPSTPAKASPPPTATPATPAHASPVTPVSSPSPKSAVASLSAPPPPSSSATKVNALVGSIGGFGFAMVMLLTL